MDLELSALKEINKANINFPYNEYISQWKKVGKKVVGWNCCSALVPEEVIHAAGIMPIWVTGDSKELSLDNANIYLTNHTCSVSRSSLEQALTKEYDFLDGFVTTYNCDGMRRLADVWRLNLSIPVIYVLSTPRKFTEKAKKFFAEEILEFKQRLEKHFNLKISDDSLRKSIDIYNNTRRLMGELYDLRKMDNPPISGLETWQILNASGRMPKEKFNQLLEDTIAEVRQKKRNTGNGSRLMIIGNILNNTEFIRNIEELGATIVVDALCPGIIYWSELVRADSDPIRSLSDRYLNKFHQARFIPYETRWNEISKLIDEYKVDGIIMEAVRYCSHHPWDIPRLNMRFKERGTPVLNLDIEYGMGMIGQIKTRVQAFLEMIAR